MIAPEYHREEEEECENEHEEQPHCFDVISHLDLLQVIMIWIVELYFITPVLRYPDCKQLLPCLEEEEQEEFPVIKFTNAAANPEAMVIKLPHTSVALPTVPASIRLLESAHIAETLRRHFNVRIVNVLHAF